MAKYATDASGAMWWPNLIQVTESVSGSDVPLAMFLSLCGQVLLDNVWFAAEIEPQTVLVRK